MRCQECQYFFYDFDGDASCVNGGDVSNPTQDIYCREAGDNESDYFDHGKENNASIKTSKNMGM